MTDDQVTSLGAVRALKTRDNRLWTPVECLRDCISDIEAGRTPCEKLLVLRLKTTDVDGRDCFDVGYNAAGVKGSEILALLECAKQMILDEMGYM